MTQVHTNVACAIVREGIFLTKDVCFGIFYKKKNKQKGKKTNKQKEKKQRTKTSFRYPCVHDVT